LSEDDEVVRDYPKYIAYSRHICNMLVHVGFMPEWNVMKFVFHESELVSYRVGLKKFTRSVSAHVNISLQHISEACRSSHDDLQWASSNALQ